MQYKELLSSLVKKSGLTLREIADKCKEHGQSIDPSYISKLQTGKLPPPSEEVSRALALVTGGDTDELVWLSFVEKAPMETRQGLRNLNPKFFITLAKEYGSNLEEEIGFMVKSISMNNRDKKRLLEKYPDKPTIEQVKNDKELKTFHYLTDEFLQKRIDALYPNKRKYDLKDLIEFLYLPDDPRLSDEFKNRFHEFIPVPRNPEEIENFKNFIEKFIDLPEKDRKELFYLTELKHKLVQEETQKLSDKKNGSQS